MEIWALPYYKYVHEHNQDVEQYQHAPSFCLKQRICFLYRHLLLVLLPCIADTAYLQAISRRATLFEMIRDFGQASTDLHRLESLLKRHIEDKVNHCGASDRMSRLNELKQIQQRLYMMEEKSRRDIPLNMYLIL